MDPLTIAALVSAGTSVAQGVGSGIRARKMRRQYDAAEANIPERDPEQVAFLDTIRQQRRNFMAGTDPISGYSRQAAMDMVGQTQANMVRTGRAGVSDLLRSQGVGERAIAGAGARSYQAGVGLLGQEGALTSALAEGAMKDRWARAGRKWAEYARAKEDSNAQIMAGLGMLPDLALGLGKAENSRPEMRRVRKQPPTSMAPRPISLPSASPIPSPEDRLMW